MSLDRKLFSLKLGFHNVSNMKDPLKNIFPEIIGSIFQHFEYQEIMKLTEVSTFWNDFISDSSVLMSSFCIKLVWNSKCDLVNYSRRRKYQNIIVDFSNYKEEDILEFIWQPQHMWKKIEFFNGVLTRNFMENLNEKVVNVTLNEINLRSNLTNKKLMFPCLKVLKLFSCNSAISDIFHNCQNLQQFEFSDNSDENNGKSFRNVLLNNSGLKSLRIFTSSFASVLPKVNNLLMFELKEFFIVSNFNEDDRKCLNRFFQHQSKVLKTIAINGNIDSQILLTCFEMSQLCQLTLSMENLGESLKLATNSSIKRLDLSFSDVPLSVYDQFLKATPNLRIFKTQFMDENSFKCLMSNCKFVEELYVEIFEATSLPDEKSFSQLKRFRSWN